MWWLNIGRDISAGEVFLEEQRFPDPHQGSPVQGFSGRKRNPLNTWLWKSMRILTMQVR